MLSNNAVNRISKLIIILSILYVSIHGINNALIHKGGYYDEDCASDKTTLVAGKNFAEKGFLSNAGLQDWCSDVKMLSWEKNFRSTDCVYKHYPPLPDWIAGVLIKIVGVEKIHNDELHYFRLFPTTIGIITLILFAYMMLSNFTTIKATIIMSAVSIIPMTNYMMAHLNMHEYIFSLLLLQLGAFFYVFKKEGKLKVKYYIFLFFLGFLQGWLSYDYFFLVSFSAIPFAILYSHMNRGENKKRLFYAIILPLSGFGFAHFLHFIQAVVYFGSLTDAFHDLVKIASFRVGGGQENEINRLSLFKRYLWPNGLVDKNIFFSTITRPFIKFVVLIVILTFFNDVSINIKKPFQAMLKWTSSYRSFFAILTALLISSLWIVFMKQYASDIGHTLYLPRHFFLLYFVSVLTVVENLCLKNISSSTEHKTNLVQKEM